MRADYKKGGSVKSPAWTRKEGKNPERGPQSPKGVPPTKKQGMNLKPPAPNPQDQERRRATQVILCPKCQG